MRSFLRPFYHLLNYLPYTVHHIASVLTLFKSNFEVQKRVDVLMLECTLESTDFLVDCMGITLVWVVLL